MVWRQPFPGPGLAIRILGEVTAERLETLRDADWIVIDEIKAAGLYREMWQSFAVLTPVRSVGVMGDGRTYGERGRDARRDLGGRHDGRLGELPYDVLAQIPAASSTRCRASTALSTTSRPSRPPRSSGSDARTGVRAVVRTNGCTQPRGSQVA